MAFGAPRMVDGVPWGYPRTPAGAAAAAVTAVAVTSQPQVVFDDAIFARVANVVFTPPAAAAEARQVAAARTRLEASAWGRQPASRRMFTFVPLTVALTGYGPAGGSASAQVWAMSLVGVGDAGGALFTTSTVRLTADGDSWRVAGVDTTQGPIPLVEGDASPPGALRAALRDSLPTLPLPLGLAVRGGS